jgi:AraC-like DNA-binding protein
VRTSELEISGTGEIEQFLIEAYGTSMRIRAEGDRPWLQHQRAGAGMVAVETVAQSGDLDAAVEPLHAIVVTRVETSQVERVTHHSDRRYGPGDLFMVSEPDLPHAARWLPGETRNAVIDPALLAEVADAGPARRPIPIHFTSLDPVSPAAAASWWATRSYVADLLAGPGIADAPLVISSAARLLAAATLATFPNTALTGPTAGDRRDAHPATLDRVIAFIDSNAHQDVTAADMAEAAHVTVRAVQLAFRRHLDMTPLQYLRRVRLDHAHHDLLAADPAAPTVTGIAHRWGFRNPSRFAAFYRQSYGVSPRHTLHRS